VSIPLRSLGSTLAVPSTVFPYGDKLSISIDFSDSPSLTKQYFADECDINTLMARYMETGILDGRDPAAARYVDCTSLQALDYQGAMNFILEAQDLFGSLPAPLRARFDNDPGLMLQFVDDPANLQEAISLGLLPDTRGSAPTVPLGTPAPASQSVAQA